MESTERRRIAAETLSRLDASFVYRDHRLFENGQFRTIAKRLRKQARYQQWLSGVLAVCFAALGALNLIEFGTSGGWGDLGLGLVLLTFAIGGPAFMVRNGTRITSTADQVLWLLDDEREQMTA